MTIRWAVPVYASSLVEIVRCHLAAGAPAAPARMVPAARGTPASLREALEARLTDPRKPRGIRHSLGSLVSVLVAGVACEYSSPLAIAGAAAGWDRDVLAAHGIRRNPVTGAYEPPSASTLGRLPAQLDADELEAGLSACLASVALDPQLAARIAARAAAGSTAGGGNRKRRRKPSAAEALRETRADGLVRAAPGHPWLDPAVTGGPHYRPAWPAVGVDGKERKLAKAGGKKKVHLLGAITHGTGLVIGQDKVAKAGKANEVTHSKPLLEPLPLGNAVITADAMQATRENARWTVEDKHAHYLVPVLGNQPGMYAQLDALDWESTPAAAATSEINRGRIETRTMRVLPAPDGPDFPYARQAILLERYVTIKKNGRWTMRNCEAVLYVTSLDASQATPADLLALIRGHWTIEHLHWLRFPGVPIAAISDKEADADRIAWHLAAAAGSADEEIAAALERSADTAKSRGGVAAGAAFLRRAAELTPDHGRRAERLVGAAEAEFTIGGASRALALIDRASPHLREPGHQAAALKLRGTIQFAVGDGRQAAATLLQAAQKLTPLDPQAARDTLLEALVAAFYSGTRARHEALAVARTAGLESSVCSSIAGLLLDGFTALLTAGPIEGTPLLRRAVGALLASDLPNEEGLRWFGLGMFAAVELFDFDAWHALATRWVTLCREKGALMTLPLALDYLGTWETFTGRLDAAEAWNAEGRDILSATGNPDLLGTRAVELLVPTWRGHADEVREAATALIRDSVEREQGAGVWYSHYALAVLEISLGNYEVALAHASVLMADNGPYFGAIILPEAAEAAMHCGDRTMADLAVERLALRARANGTDLARGLLARCQALTSRTGDNEAYYVQAIQHLERCRAASEVARSHLLFGEWLRRQRRRNEARQHLRAAYESFEEIGALKFAERADRELAATGARALRTQARELSADSRRDRMSRGTAADDGVSLG